MKERETKIEKGVLQQGSMKTPSKEGKR